MGMARLRVDLHSMIVKTKFVCKTTMSEVPRHSKSIQWQKVFIEGNTYVGEYETWSWSRGYEVNGGWKRYWSFGFDGAGFNCHDRGRYR